MGNRTPEQDLIDRFIDALKRHEDPKIRIETLYNKNCKAKAWADIEYLSKSGLHWAIEAKSHESSDRHNTVHKLFGELLKETGRESRGRANISILIPEEGVTFYSRLLQSICKEKYLGFGALVPVECVFTFGASGVIQLSWEALYDHQ